VLKGVQRNLADVCSMASSDYGGHWFSGNIRMASIKCGGLLDCLNNLASQEGKRHVGSVCFQYIRAGCTELCCNTGKYQNTALCVDQFPVTPFYF
jgi:hypothetical protein